MNATMHPVAPEEIMAFLDGELSADRAQSVSAHIEQCAGCGEIGESLRATSRKMAAWTVEAPGCLNECDILGDTGTITSRGKSNSSFSMLRRVLSRTWVWAPALSLAVALVAFIVVLPNLFVRHRTVSQSNAVMLEPVRPFDISPYQAKLPAGGGGGGGEAAGHGSLGKLEEDAPLGSPAAADRFSNAIPLAEKGRNQVSQALGQPMIARMVSLSIVVKDFNAGRASLDAILARRNGYAASLNVSTPQGTARTLQASLRIPAPQLAAALAELKVLGRVEIETQNGEEVTQQHADLVARLKNSRETEQRLQDVLRTRTGKVKDVLEVEEEIARVRGEIEQMEAEQQTVEHRVNFATIDLNLAEEYKAQLTTPALSVAIQLRNATVDGFRTALQSFLALVLFLAESGPTLLLWLMILSFPAWLLWRRYQRTLAMRSTAGV